MMSESTAEHATMRYLVTATHEEKSASMCGITEWSTPRGAEDQRRFLEAMGYTVTIVGKSK